MTKKQKGAARIGIPVTLLLGSLVGLGVNHEKIRTNENGIKTKVEIAVFQEFKESNQKEHELMIKYLEAINGEKIPE